MAASCSLVTDADPALVFVSMPEEEILLDGAKKQKQTQNDV